MQPLSPPSPVSGGPPTLAQVYQAHAAFVRDLMKRKVPSRDLPDLVQMSFMEIDRGLPAYNPARPIQPWIATIVFRTVQRYYRRLILRLRAEQAFCMDPSDFVPSCSERIQARSVLLSYFASLKNDRQLEVVLRYLGDEEPMEVIARDLGISADGGYKLLQAALAKLKGARERADLIERRQLDKRGVLLLPPRLSLRVQAWMAQVRERLGRSLMGLKGTLGSLGAAAGLVVMLGALPPPSGQSTLGDQGAPVIVVAAPEPSAAKAASDAVMATSRVSAPAVVRVSAPTSSTRKTATSPSRDAEVDAAELASLRIILAKLKTNPIAARAAFKRHRKMFPGGELSDELEQLEMSAQAQIER